MTQIGNIIRNNEDGQAIVYGGLTSDYLGVKKSLTAFKTVAPCSTYHLKLAIADRGDSAFDSGVFVSEIKGGKFAIDLESQYGVDYFVEGCSGDLDTLAFRLKEALDDTIAVKLLIGGSAVVGQDYITPLVNGQILTFAPGEIEKKFPIVPIEDAFQEGIETILMSLVTDFGCGDVEVVGFQAIIADLPIIDINLGADTAIVCKGVPFDLGVLGAVDYVWTPGGIFNDSISPNPQIITDTSVWVSVVGTFPDDPLKCKDFDSIYLNVVDPMLSIVPLTDTNVCNGDTVLLEAVNNLDNINLEWAPNFNIISTDLTQPIIAVAPFFTTNVSASVSIGNCMVTDDIDINVDFLTLPFMFVDEDTTICEGSTIDLASDIFFGTTTYNWTPGTYLSDSTVSGPTAMPLGDISYTLISTSQNAYCADTVTVDVEVIPAKVDIMPDDRVFICLGDTTQLQAITTSGSITWSPANGTLSSTSQLNVSAFPKITTQYVGQMTVGICTVYDTIVVQVDSLPMPMDIMATPDKEFYCPGDTVILTSSIYEPGHFPAITHNWSPGAGVVTPVENYNMIFFATDDITYTRITANNACADTFSIDIQVADTAIQLSLTDTIVCKGQSFQVMALNGSDFEWSPNNILSCTECPDPIVTPQENGTIYTVMGINEDCPAVGSFQAFLFPGVNSVDIVPDPAGGIPEGAEITLEAITVPDISTTGLYEWKKQDAHFPGNTSIITDRPVDNPTIYSVLVTDEFGCIVVDTHTIYTIPPLIEVPNVFTPNGDNTNDVFSVVTDGLVTLDRFQIFDRWGQLVYETEDITEGWDGKIDGKDAPSDVYVYVIDVRRANGVIKSFAGDVTLIR